MARLFVLSGPSGVGKSTLVKRIVPTRPDLHVSISATTRECRPGEQDGRDYFFISEEEFRRRIEAGEFLEWARVHGSLYGTPRGPVEEALNAGRNVLLEIDLQGARSVREAMPEAVLVFLEPPSWDELASRLEGRRTERPEQVAQRLETAVRELAAAEEFDARVVNDDLDRAVDAVLAIIDGYERR